MDKVRLTYDTDKGVSEKLPKQRKTAYHRFIEFEHALRFCLAELNDEESISDYWLLESLYNSIVIFAMKKRFNENNPVFLQNAKDTFYESLDHLIKRHPNIKGKLDIVKKFMEDFYIEK